MKIREGFVSNSSSSSFIASIPNDSYEVEIVIKKKIRFADHGDTIKNKKQLDAHIIEQYGCRDDKIETVLEDNTWIAKVYPQCIKELEKGKVIVFGSFGSDSCDSMEQYLCEYGLNGKVKDKNIKIIHSEGGY